MPRRRRQPQADFLPSSEAQALLKADTPARVKQALRLAQAGGRRQKRTCLVCGRAARHCLTWADEAAWRVEPGRNTRVLVYWLCERAFPVHRRNFVRWTRIAFVNNHLQALAKNEG
jgi:hypothetical protein